MDALRVRQGRGVQADQESRGGRECRGGGGVSTAWRQRWALGPERRRGEPVLAGSCREELRKRPGVGLLGGKNEGRTECLG